MKPDNAIDPLYREFFERPLWCVYGPDCFPTLIACKVNASSGKPAVWGYSVYRNSGGYRTLGNDVEAFIKRHEVCAFFDDQEAALAYIGALTRPSRKALKDLEVERAELDRHAAQAAVWSAAMDAAGY